MSRTAGRVADCACCTCRGLIVGRGLCGPCYDRARRTGTLIDWPRRLMPAADFADAYAVLRARFPRYEHRQLAAELGMTYVAFDRALCRMRATARTSGVASTSRVG